MLHPSTLLFHFPHSFPPGADIIASLSYWRRPSFWGLLCIGWLVSFCFFGILAACAGLYTFLYRRLDVPVWLIIVAINALALISGWEFARQRVRRASTRGFPVKMKDDE